MSQTPVKFKNAIQMKHYFLTLCRRGCLHNSTRLKCALHPLIAFVVAFTILFFIMDRMINIYDEGIVLTAAMRVAAGEIIHRDFYTNYGPAPYYLVSCLFKLFGQHVLVERVLDLTVRAGILALTYSSLVYYSRRWIALVVTALCALWLCTVGNHGYPIYPALLLAMGSTLILTQVLTRNGSIWHPFVAADRKLTHLEGFC